MSLTGRRDPTREAASLLSEENLFKSGGVECCSYEQVPGLQEEA